MEAFAQKEMYSHYFLIAWLSRGIATLTYGKDSKDALISKSSSKHVI